MSIVCLPHDWHKDFRIELFIASTDHILLVYRVVIYQKLFVEFSCNSYKTLCNIRLLSMLLTVLVSGCHNKATITR